MNGVWLALYLDRSDLAIFGSEIDALRYALDRGMKVKWWPIDTGIGVPETGLSTEGTITQPGYPQPSEVDPLYGDKPWLSDEPTDLDPT